MREPKKPEAPLTYAEFIAYAEAHEGRFEFDDGAIVDMGIRAMLTKTSRERCSKPSILT